MAIPHNLTNFFVKITCIIISISFSIVSVAQKDSVVLKNGDVVTGVPKPKGKGDSIILKNGDVIVGELKSMDKGIITVETPYSKNDFTIEWSGVKEIYSISSFLITLKDGKRINGYLHSADGGKKVMITSKEGKQEETNLNDIVYLKGLKSNFWSRASASIDLGLSVTKANNLVQYNMRSALGYLADKWALDFFYDDLRSKQDSIQATKRTESGGSYTYFLPKDWYLNGALNTLSNTEQALDLRVTAR